MTERKPTDYAELKAWQELAWWATHYLSMIAVEHYGYSVEEIKPLENAERNIWNFTWELGKQYAGNQEGRDIFYGDIQYWRDNGPAFWQKYDELQKAFNRLARELL